ncbi:MAG: aminoacyl-tRNA hydrolase [Actinobacteria bacterium]|jgi:PTH1 family peptidyl-tRNA hydrolase|nr:aminoacyl-tRNA hydrolase [Actinomycetota bacterium]
MTSHSQETWLVVGLGNPGDKYSATRHNIGFQVADNLALRLHEKFAASKHRALVAETRLGFGADAPKVIIAKPQTYMNDSGDAVSPLAKYFGTAPDRIIAIHDELDIEFNTLRVKLGGGDNGHNGLKSLTQSLATSDYFRVRVGIGRPNTPQDTADYVLDNFSRNEKSALPELLDRACDAIESLITKGLENTQQNFNQ